MTEIYFVRHAQSLCGFKGSDQDKPLTETGLKDSEVVTIALRDIKFDYCLCSTYKRSIDTIKSCCLYHNLVINTDERLKERVGGKNATEEDLEKRWLDFNYHEDGGESLGSCQKRNIETLNEVLLNHQNETILIGTHGTALCTILNYYDKSIDVNYFYKIFNWLPHVIHATFDQERLVTYELVVLLNRGY